MIPDPTGFPTWTAWALQVVRVLSPLLTEIQAAFTRQGTAHKMPTHTVATLPAVSLPSRWIYVSDEAGGAIPAYNDGTNWRRASDRAVVS
jgi:hypothetical protein